MSSSRHRRRDHEQLRLPRNRLQAIWHAFWNPPEETCPKCGNTMVQYYDPFFFSPLRTLRGRRRIRCSICHFIWRPSSKGRSIRDLLGLRF